MKRCKKVRFSFKFFTCCERLCSSSDERRRFLRSLTSPCSLSLVAVCRSAASRSSVSCRVESFRRASVSLRAVSLRRSWLTSFLTSTTLPVEVERH